LAKTAVIHALFRRSAVDCIKDNFQLFISNNFAAENFWHSLEFRRETWARQHGRHTAARRHSVGLFLQERRTRLYHFRSITTLHGSDIQWAHHKL